MLKLSLKPRNNLLYTNSCISYNSCVSYNDNCSICMEDFDLNLDLQTSQLTCNHTFHSTCIMQYIYIENKRLSKIKNSYIICFKNFKCPLCRTPINGKYISVTSYSKYKYYKNLYKQIKKDIKQLQKESYLFTIKFSIKKLYTKITLQDVYNYLIKDENLLELICNKKQELYETKNIKNIYKNLYYKKCNCCIK
jgi:hypothetical protein